MWDLSEIIRRNNQAAIDYMMQGRKVDVAQSPQPKAWSLSLLAEKLKVGPPLLAELLDCFTNYDTLEGFLTLIRQFLPEHEGEILSESGGQRVYRFCYLFGKKYYPLPINAGQADVAELVSGLPVGLMAMSYSAYHDLGMRTGYRLLLSLVIYPYEGDERDEEEDEGPGGRVPLLDAVLHVVGPDLVSLIPEDGWHPSELHLMTDGTPYDGVGHFADWACSETGCIVLDSSYEDCAYMEGNGEPIFKWTQSNVETLAEQWPRVQEFRQKIDHMVEWLEADPVLRLRELLEFLTAAAKRKNAAKPRSGHYEPFEHRCPLTQESQDEEEGE